LAAARTAATITLVYERLLSSAPPAVRNRVLGEPFSDFELARRLIDGAAGTPVYAKWQGPHWVLAALADIGYPPGDSSLVPLRERVLAKWLDSPVVRVLDGRPRVHASQQGNALRSLVALGLADSRCDRSF
jgi:hypothetical protein